MLKLSLNLPVPEEAKLRAKAEGLGLSLAGYVAQVVRDSLRQDTDPLRSELLSAVRALVPVFAEALSRTLSKTPEQMERLTQTSLAR